LPHWQNDWEEPTTAPPDPDLEPWINECPEGKNHREAVQHGFELVHDRKANLTCLQFLGRAIPAVFFAALSVIWAVQLMLAPYIQPHNATLI
jgi:hypothetical protein